MVFTKNGVADVYQPGTGATVPLDQWVHLAVTVSSTTGVTYFIDGGDEGTNAHTANGNAGGDAFVYTTPPPRSITQNQN